MSTSSSYGIESAGQGAVRSGGCGEVTARATPFVYAIGALGYDFGTYARRDAFEAVNGGIPILTHADLSNYLVLAPSDANSIIWTLNIDNTPVYAVRAVGTYAKKTYKQLQAYLLDPNIDMISVAGRIGDSVTLLNGEVVPVIEPDLLGLQVWSPSAIVVPTGQLTVSAAPLASGTPVDLTSDGSLDWVHWGLNQPTDQNQKLSAALPGIAIGRQISHGNWPAARQTGYRASFRWNDGTPLLNFSPNPALPPSGYLQVNSQSAFALTVPADTNLRTLKLYIRNDGGSSGGTCKLTVNLTGIPTVTDETFFAPANESIDGVYTIAFRIPPGTPGTSTLTIDWRPSTPNNFAGLQAASLQMGTATRSSALQSYLDRIYFELRNMGAHARERALNYAASCAATEVMRRFDNTLFGGMFGQGMVLDGIDVKRNERCRPGRDCWDVLFEFFNPMSNREWSRSVFRISVDVSLVKPTTLGRLQGWNEV